MHQHRRGGVFDQSDTKTPRSTRTHHRRVRPRATAAPRGAGNAPSSRRGRVFEQPRHEDALWHSSSPGFTISPSSKIPQGVRSHTFTAESAHVAHLTTQSGRQGTFTDCEPAVTTSQPPPHNLATRRRLTFPHSKKVSTPATSEPPR